MSIGKLILFLIVFAYSIYYAIIFFGVIKKDFIVEDENATVLQRTVAFITPPGPPERNREIKEKIEFLQQQLSVEESNLVNYEQWLANAIANPPT